MRRTPTRRPRWRQACSAAVRRPAAATVSGQDLGQWCGSNFGQSATSTINSGNCLAWATSFNRRVGNSVWYQSPNWAGFSGRVQYGATSGATSNATNSGRPLPRVGQAATLERWPELHARRAIRQVWVTSTTRTTSRRRRVASARRALARLLSKPLTAPPDSRSAVLRLMPLPSPATRRLHPGRLQCRERDQRRRLERLERQPPLHIRVRPVDRRLLRVDQVEDGLQQQPGAQWLWLSGQLRARGLQRDRDQAACVASGCGLSARRAHLWSAVRAWQRYKGASAGWRLQRRQPPA